jgi:hypothetical protein
MKGRNVRKIIDRELSVSRDVSSGVNTNTVMLINADSAVRAITSAAVIDEAHQGSMSFTVD